MFYSVLLFQFFIVFYSLFAHGSYLQASDFEPVVFPHSGDSEFIDFTPFVENGRFLQINMGEEYGNKTAITYDYSGVTVQGVITPMDEKSNIQQYSLYFGLIYRCLTSGVNGNMFSIKINMKETMVIDIGDKGPQKTCGKLTKFLIAKNLVGPVEVQVVKITEPNYSEENANISNNVTFTGFEVTGITNVGIVPLPRFRRRIEFIGDSITCGAHISCPAMKKSSSISNFFQNKKDERNDVVKIHDYPHEYSYEDVTKTYAGRACEFLDVSCFVDCWSSRGLAFNYNHWPTLMPELYERTLETVPSIKWDFSNTLFTPDVLLIDLGTNDQNKAPNWGDVFYHAYLKFLKDIHEKYNYTNNLLIVGVCGPTDYLYCEYVERAINESKPYYSNFYYFRFSVMPNTTICSGHPDRAVSILLANELVAFIKKITGWN